jgi:hypothetical protein
VLSRKFRGRFLFYLKQAYFGRKLSFTGDVDYLKDKYQFQCLKDKLYNKECVVYCKPPFQSAEHVLGYLGRYTHRVAISNNRIVKFEDGYVTFKWRDYKDKNKQKLMKVTAEEFIRRFLMHILPNKFVKIRHYGILSNRNRNLKLKKCKALTGTSLKINTPIEKLTAAELLLRLTGKDINLCLCSQNHEHLTATILGVDYEGYCYYLDNNEEKIIFLEEYCEGNKQCLSIKQLNAYSKIHPEERWIFASKDIDTNVVFKEWINSIIKSTE